MLVLEVRSAALLRARKNTFAHNFLSTKSP
jgi:hypothetical protein